MDRRKKLKKLILASIFCALIVVMTFVPYTGYISYGLIEITTLHIVVIIGATLLGWQYGTLLGFVWGITCLIRAYLMPAFLVFGFGNPLVAVLPRVLVGMAAGAVFGGLKKTRMNRSLSLSIAAVAGTLTNTVLVLTGMWLYCKFSPNVDNLTIGQQSVFDTLKSILATIVGLNGGIELVAAVIITPAVYFAVQPREKVIGVDIGASMTKIVLAQNGRCLKTQLVDPNETLEAALDAFGKSGAARVAITGVGASYIEGDLLGLPTRRVEEFVSLYRGAARIAKNHNCLVVSIGTGTSFVRVTPLGAWHLGGSGVGGGMLKGLSQRLIRQSDVDGLMRLAREGDLHRVNIQLQDVSRDTISNLSMTSTVANMAKVDQDTTSADIAAGICNLVFESLGVMAAFAVKKHWTRTVVIVGTIADEPVVKESLDSVATLHHVRFLIPRNAGFATALGATLS